MVSDERKVSNYEYSLYKKIVEPNFKDVPHDYVEAFFYLVPPASHLVIQEYSSWYKEEYFQMLQHTFMTRRILIPYIIHTLWNKEQELPRLNKQQTKFYKTLAYLYSVVITICDRLYEDNEIHIYKKYGKAYLFFRIFLEIDLENTYSWQGKNIKLSNKKNGSLREEINPFNHRISPATHFFTECCFHLNGRDDVFRNTLWQEFLKARKEYVKQKSKPLCNSIYANNKKEICSRTSNGRGRTLKPLI